MTNKQKTDWESIEKIVEDIMQCGFEVAMGGDMYKDEEENKKLQEEKYNECVAVFTHKISRLLKTQRQQLISEIEGIKRLPNMAQNQNGNEYCSACGCPWDNIDNYCPDCATHNQALVDIIKILEKK